MKSDLKEDFLTGYDWVTWKSGGFKWIWLLRGQVGFEFLNFFFQKEPFQSKFHFKSSVDA